MTSLLPARSSARKHRRSGAPLSTATPNSRRGRSTIRGAMACLTREDRDGLRHAPLVALGCPGRRLTSSGALARSEAHGVAERPSRRRPRTRSRRSDLRRIGLDLRGTPPRPRRSRANTHPELARSRCATGEASTQASDTATACSAFPPVEAATNALPRLGPPVTNVRVGHTRRGDINACR